MNVKQARKNKRQQDKGDEATATVACSGSGSNWRRATTASDPTITAGKYAQKKIRRAVAVTAETTTNVVRTHTSRHM